MKRVVNYEKLFASFLEEKRYLNNVSPATVRLYSHAWKAFKRHQGEVTEPGLKAFMVAILKSGVQPGTANAYARCLNSFLTWLFESGHTTVRLRIPLTPTGNRVLKTYTPEEVSKIVSYKPRCYIGRRIIVILCLLIDTGARANEVLTLTRGAIDWDSLLVTLKGKGGKERRVPISLECRKVLFRWLQTHQFDYVFATKTGAQLRYDNMRRDFLWLLNKAGVQKSEGSFHAFRRFFGKSYLRGGGNLIYLQKLFGHASLQMTQRYVEADDEDLQRAHRALSPLEGLKKR